jgi:hypothetical protein
MHYVKCSEVGKGQPDTPFQRTSLVVTNFAYAKFAPTRVGR